ncbi:restriction endonuclease subunit S [Burkholderia cenocepacia]|nr:restriction endonuclease subunit S [Burkholderia cenocepacia]MDN7623823.1 restriction endonuclease subunit S [Burkholderia cenocepacia]
MIPTDWGVEPLSACSETSSGTTPARAAAERYFHGGTIPWVKTLDLNNSVLNATDECVTETALRETSLRLYPAGSVLVAMYGGFAQIGRTGLLPFPATINQALTAICPNRRKLDSRYLLYYLNYHVDYWKSVASSSRKDPNITGNDVRNFLIALPSTEEQRLIATAMSDVDALLDGLTGLIAKKRDLKQAFMRQLLTGENRLPGFSGAWKTITLGELGLTYGGLTGKTKSDFGVGTGRYVTFMNVMANVVIDCEAFDQVRVSSNESQNRVIQGDLLFNGSSETPEEVALCSYMAKDVPDLFLNSFCFGFRLRDKQQADGLFLSYYIRATPGRELMKSLAQGSTRYNVSKGALLQASVLLPSKDEQTAIAAVLSDMDAELAALGARLAKTRALKQAMMQELLTGKTRLLPLEVAHV